MAASFTCMSTALEHPLASAYAYMVQQIDLGEKRDSGGCGMGEGGLSVQQNILFLF